VVIVGGGVIGLSVAYHLGKRGVDDVLLLERNRLSSGTSWHAAGIIGPLRASMNLTKLAIYATELFTRLEEETGQSTGYRRTGGLWLATTEARLTEVKRIAAMGTMNNLGVEILSPDEAAARLPLLHTKDLAGALYVSEDGQVNPVDLCMAYAKGARSHGIEIREGASVAEFVRSGKKIKAVRLADGSRIDCDLVVNCAGLWARELGALAGVSVPVQSAEHMYVVTEAMEDLPAPFPIVRDLDGGIYIKEDAGKLLLGGFERDAKVWDPRSVAPESAFLMLPDDWDHFEPFLTAGLHRVPVLERAGIQQFMNGPESFTPDTRQVMGKAPDLDNYFIAAGFNSIGIVSSAGVGRVMADWIVENEPPMDLWEVDINRFEASASAPAFLHARLGEALHNQFAMHWPLKQHRSGRGVKRTPLHDFLAEEGAVFGCPAGWERPLWFAETEEEAELRYSYGEQHWWPYAARETAALRDAVGLIDLTPFGKFLIEGSDSARFLQHSCAADIEVEPGRTVYSAMLNTKGGIEADVTVTRLEERRFLVVSAAATRIKDAVRLRKLCQYSERVRITDVTSNYAVLGVMGPKSRALLQSLGAGDLSSAAFPFAQSRNISIAAADVRAVRISFVGELGWELYIPSEFAPYVYERLREAGRQFGLAQVGMLALDSCRLEKAYRHWGHDTGADDSPLEAGLGFAVAFDKKDDFIGRDALLRQRGQGTARRLLLFRVGAEKPLLLHDEPIYREGELVGMTTSGGLGFRTGLALSFGYVAREPGMTMADLLSQSYEIEIAGERYSMTALARAPYDPDGERMKA
jgi:4-methylaminobutanoate oxidase (formaldehyde-forming)